MSFNKFTGPLPASLPNSSRLKVLYLSANAFTGKEVFLASKICGPSLRRLLLADNDLSGVVPLESCSSLAAIDVSCNFMTCAFPPTLSNCSSLKWLTLSNNRLTSHIPPELGLMPRINFLHLGNNSLSGTIPPTLGNCRYLVWLDLSSNELEGIIPRELTKQAGKVIKGTLSTGLRFGYFKYLYGDVCTEYGLGSLLMMRGKPEG